MGAWTVPIGNCVNPLDDPDIDPTVGYPHCSDAGIAKYTRSGEGPRTVIGMFGYRVRTLAVNISQKMADSRYHRGRRYQELGPVLYYSLCTITPVVATTALVVALRLAFVASVRRASAQGAKHRSVRVPYAMRWLGDSYNPAMLGGYTKKAASIVRPLPQSPSVGDIASSSKAYEGSYGIGPHSTVNVKSSNTPSIRKGAHPSSCVF